MIFSVALCEVVSYRAIVSYRMICMNVYIMKADSRINILLNQMKMFLLQIDVYIVFFSFYATFIWRCNMRRKQIVARAYEINWAGQSQV